MLKKVLVLISLVLGSLMGLMVLALVLVNPNDYKADIEQHVSSTLNRNFVIGGDIGWDIWPGVGLELSHIRLSNPESVEPSDLFTMKKARVALSLLPLLQRELMVNEVWVEGIHINLITTKQGMSSLDGLGATAPTSQETDGTASGTPSRSTTNTPLSELYVGGVTFKDINIVIDNRQEQTEQAFHLEELSLSQFALGDKAQATLKASAQLDGFVADLVTQAQFTLSEAMDEVRLHAIHTNVAARGESLPTGGKLDVAIKAQGRIQLSPLSVELTEININAGEQLNGNGTLSFKQHVLPKVNVQFAFDAVNLDALLPAEQAGTTTPDEPSEPASEPDLRVLNQFELDGLFKFTELVINNVTMQDVQVPVSVKQGVLSTTPQFALYGGSVKIDAKINGQRAVARYQSTVELDGVQARPLLSDAAGIDVLAGATRLALAISGEGLLPDTIKRQAKGQGSVTFSDGALYGVNIPQMLRKAKAAFSGGLAEEQLVERKTDFTSLVAHFSLANGMLDNPDLTMLSPLITIQGNGSFNLIDTAIDYQTVTEIVGSLEGQGREDDSLAGVKIPLYVSGTVDDLSYKLDMQKALESKATQELKNKADNELKKAKDKLKNKLGSFLGGR